MKFLKVASYRKFTTNNDYTSKSKEIFDEITCPYCYSYTHYIYGIECRCESCRQLLNDGDIIYDNQ